MITVKPGWSLPENLPELHRAAEQVLVEHGIKIVIDLGHTPFREQGDDVGGLGLLIQLRRRCHGMDARLPLVVSDSNPQLALIRKHPAFEIYPTVEQAAAALGVNQCWFETSSHTGHCVPDFTSRDALPLRAVIIKLVPGNVQQQMQAFIAEIDRTLRKAGLSNEASIVSCWADAGFVHVKCTDRVAEALKKIERVDGVITLSS